MALPYIYADFNALNPHADDAIVEMQITGYGTLASLARQKLRFTEGMAMVVYEPMDIECEATAHYDSLLKDPAGRPGAWVVRLNPTNIRESVQSQDNNGEHPCIICGHDFKVSFARGRNYTEHCVSCGASVMEPLAPPYNAT